MSAALIAIGAPPGAGPVQAATFVVNTTTDAGDTFISSDTFIPGDTFATFSPDAPALINTVTEVQTAEAFWIKTSEAVDLVAVR